MRHRVARLRSSVAVAVIASLGAACANGERPSFAVETLSAPTAVTTLPSRETAPAPTTVASITAAPRPTADRPVTVVLDPGHNGANSQWTEQIRQLVDVGNGTKACNTTGTETASGVAESEINWSISLLVRDQLEAKGWTVYLTRDSNDGWGPCIDQRAAVGNGVEADAVISIHADGGPPEGTGFHVIVPAALPGLTDDIAEDSAELGDDLREALVEAGFGPSDYVGDNGLITRSDIGGLNLSDVPTVFAELGNLRNEEDAGLLTTAAGQQQAADAIVSALERFLGVG